MTNPGDILDAVSRDAADLDRLSKAIFEATALLDEAEDAWLRAFDDVMQTLEEEYAEAGRKSVPEHTALSAARRAHPSEYRTYRRAKRAVERLQQQLSAKRSAASARQSELGALREEMRALSMAGRPN